MKRVVMSMLLLVTCLVVSAGSKKLPNGEVAYWDDRTGNLEYGCYRAEIKLSEKCDFNVWGEITIGKQSKSFMIKAGETSGYADFENLDKSGHRVSVTIKNKDGKKK